MRLSSVCFPYVKSTISVYTFLPGPLPPAIMDQLAAAAAAQYVGQPGVVPPGPQATPQSQPPPPHQPPQQHIHRSNVIDAAVQTDVTTVVQSKQVGVLWKLVGGLGDGESVMEKFEVPHFLTTSEKLWLMKS